MSTKLKTEKPTESPPVALPLSSLRWLSPIFPQEGPTEGLSTPPQVPAGRLSAIPSLTQRWWSLQPTRARRWSGSWMTLFSALPRHSNDIPTSVVSISDNTKSGLANLQTASLSADLLRYLPKNITIPSSVTSIGKFAFYGCTGLTSVTFANTSGWYRTSTATGDTAIDVTDPATNATNLRSTYSGYYWKRKP